jgi:hypothetical protein
VTDGAAEGSRRATIGVLLSAAGLHAALLVYFFPWRLFASKLPVFEYDYALHAYQVDRALAAFESHGKLWSYDPLVLSGQPAGAIEDLTSKSLEAFVIAAHALGANPWIAFDTYVLLVHLGLVPVAWAAARLFGFDRLSSAVAVLFWVLVWHFDSFSHWCWYIGMISWALASYLTVLVVALLYRALRERTPASYAALAAAAAIVTFVHPFAVLTLVVPAAASYVSSFRRLRPMDHTALVASAIMAGSTALVWIGPAVKFRHYIGPVDAFLWPTASYALFDWLELLKDLAMTGEPVRTAFRSVFFVLAAVALLRLRRARDDRLWPLALLIGFAIAQAYLSGYSNVLRQTQPYRHIAPATLAAALLAAWLVVELGRTPGQRFSRDTRTALAFAALAALPPFVRTVSGYVPALLPGREYHRTAFRPGPGVEGSSAERDPPFMGHGPPPAEYARIGEVVTALAGDRGRVATFDWVLGEYLATFAKVPTLGGIAERNVPHVAAHPMRHDFTPASSGDDPVARYLSEYAVAVVVTQGDAKAFDERADLLEQVTAIGRFRVYRSRGTVSYFASGHGRVVEQRPNLIRVADAGGSEIVLRFHFMETLRCRPDCRVSRALADRDSVGFIRIENPPSAFEIYNAYD